MRLVLLAVGRWREIAAGNGITSAEIENMAPAFDETQLERASEFVSKHEFPTGSGSSPRSAGTGAALARYRPSS